MRRVLMISPHFPPDTSAGAHRVRLLAPYLSAFGWEPTVITVDPGSYEGRLDPDLARLVPSTLRVLRAPAWPASITRRLGIGDLGLRALPALGRVSDDLLRRERFDALFITTYPTYPAMLGPWIKRRYRLPFVLDYQDPWVGAWGVEVGGGPNGTPDVKSRLTRAIAQHIEPHVVRAADALTAVSSRTYEDVLARVGDARPRVCETIPLGFDERDLDALGRTPRRNPHFDSGDGFVHVCYVGTVLPKSGPVLETVLRGLALLRQRTPSVYGRLRLHFLGTSNQRDPRMAPRVIPVAERFGVADIVSEVAPRLDYLDALNAQVMADALLLMGSTEPHYTPSKVFPALLSGRPLVAVYHSSSNVLDLLRAGGLDAATITFDDEQALESCAGRVADALERVATKTMPTAIAVARQSLEPWSAQALAGQLASVFDRVAA
jgi:glycosyltransferase involved in cell wall biosynthesis